MAPPVYHLKTPKGKLKYSGPNRFGTNLPINDHTAPHPPHLVSTDPVWFLIGLLIAFFSLIVVTVIIDKLGTAMFHRGFAKPFYIRGRRIHHRVIYLIIPIAYGVFAILFILGYITISWNAVWYQLAILAAIVAGCVGMDAIGDRFWPEIRKNVILHHEWFYVLIPAYMFGVMFTIVI